MALTAQQRSMAFGEAAFAGALANTGYNVNMPIQNITSDNAIGTTGQMTFTPIPLHGGDVVTKMSVMVGATAGATLTHRWCAIYSAIAVPALLGQSTDNTAASMAANTLNTETFNAAITIPSDGLYFAAICVTGTTIPTLLGKITGTVAAQITALSTFLTLASVAGGTATGAASTAPATIASITNTLVPFWVCVQ